MLSPPQHTAFIRAEAFPASDLHLAHSTDGLVFAGKERFNGAFGYVHFR